MSKQKSIMNFFQTSSVVGKRPLSDSSNMSSKKVKNSDITIEKDTITNSEDDLSSQNESNNLNKMRAQIKLLSKKLTIVDSDMGLSWYQALQKEFSKPYFEKLNAFVSQEYNNCTVYPPREKIWTWTKTCSVSQVKVVILGQDPYHNPGQAHGLCFSVPPGVRKPPSLVNMFKEIKNDIKPEHDEFDNGNLEGWAAQGVLLLNAVLTVRENKPNSHQDKGWEQLTTAVIKHLNDNSTGVVFLLWGAYAQKKASFVDAKKHHVLKAAHPSPLSAHKGFFGCQHFSKCNEFLKQQGKSEINWHILTSVENE
ncbi:uracil-DNA glycosylase 2 [Nilaparvata lugens]|uniref:uracil-DNA glycosylase 2 n=1 Tax=Nilaparvata lugens TaxID=108931 RepID=UPI000B9872EC|nr:uracil-DNA glycosylase 2 [Nilaparvata lugens]